MSRHQQVQYTYDIVLLPLVDPAAQWVPDLFRAWKSKVMVLSLRLPMTSHQSIISIMKRRCIVQCSLTKPETLSTIKTKYALFCYRFRKRNKPSVQNSNTKMYQDRNLSHRVLTYCKLVLYVLPFFIFQLEQKKNKKHCLSNNDSRLNLLQIFLEFKETVDKEWIVSTNYILKKRLKSKAYFNCRIYVLCSL